VAVGGAVIGNNRPKGKPLDPVVPPPNASSGSQKSEQKLRKLLVNRR
jgi:hypothetical protein